MYHRDRSGPSEHDLDRPLGVCAMVSGTRTLAARPLCAMGCRVGPSWIGLVRHIPMVARSNWDLGNLEAGSAALGSLVAGTVHNGP